VVGITPRGSRPSRLAPGGLDRAGRTRWLMQAQVRKHQGPCGSVIQPKTRNVIGAIRSGGASTVEAGSVAVSVVIRS